MANRRKKKKQRRTLEQQSLQGWNCSAVDVTDDQADDIEADEEIEEVPLPVKAPPAPAAMLLEPEPEPEQLTLEAPPPPEPPRPPSAEEVYYALVEEYARQAMAAQAASIREVAPPQDKPAAIRQEPASAQQEEPVSIRQEPAAIRREEPPVFAEAATPETAAPPQEEPPAKPSLVQRLRLRMAPPPSPQEQAEDEEKFGGLDDDPVDLDDAMSEPVHLAEVARRTTLRVKRVVAVSREEGSQVVRGVRDFGSWAYEECYYLGVQLQRYQHDLRRRVFRGAMWVKYTIPPFFRQRQRQLLRALDRFSDSCMEPFRDIAVKTRSMRYQLHHRDTEVPDGRRGGIPAVLVRYVYSLGKPINRIANFLLPILGCAVLAFIILYFQQVNYALEVEYAGVNMGYVQKESDFYQAKDIVSDRLMNEEFVPLDNSNPKFKLAIVEPQQLTSVEALANRIMTTSKNEVSSADGIYIDGAFLGAVEDGNEFLLYIDGILENYRTEEKNERVQFVKKVAVQRGIFPTSSLRQVHEIKNAVESNETVPQLHKVQELETLETIAESNNTTVKDIMRLNPQLERRAEETQEEIPPLSVGEEIMLNRVELSLGIQVTRRESYTESIEFGTDYVDDNTQLDSYQVTLTSGILGKREITADFTYIDGEKVDETRVSAVVVKEPVNAKVRKGTLKPAQFLPAGSDTSASFVWPVAGGYLSAGLYGYRGHTGMDIAASYGTGIYAARSGTVSFAVNYSYGAYGKRVDINHGNNVMTRYAHCSEVLVQAGQYVKQGQLIAKVGRTGNAYGNHCHFEIRINGKIMNPADFIGKVYPGGY